MKDINKNIEFTELMKGAGIKNDATLEMTGELISFLLKNPVSKLTELLRNANQEKTEITTDPYIKYVLESVSKAFNMTEKHLLYSRYIRGEHKYAIGLVVYYLYKEMSMGNIKTQVFTNKDLGLLTRYRKMIENLNKRHKNDLPYLNIKSELDLKIENFKNAQ